MASRDPRCLTVTNFLIMGQSVADISYSNFSFSFQNRSCRHLGYVKFSNYVRKVCVSLFFLSLTSRYYAHVYNKAAKHRIMQKTLYYSAQINCCFWYLCFFCYQFEYFSVIA